MKALVNFTYFFKEQLDKMYKTNPETTAEELVERFTDKFEDVPHIGRMPAEEAEHASEWYGDYVGFLMVHDGNSPENYFVERYIEKQTAEAIVEFYQNHDGVNRSLKDLANYLYHLNVFHFGNILRNARLVPMSPKHLLTNKTARAYVPVHKLYKPRYYQIVCKGDPVRKRTMAAVIQPDRRKNEFIEEWGPAYFVVNPYVILRPV